jgi:tellurite resistance protein
MQSTSPAKSASEGALSYLPVSLFGSVMGLTGLALAWRLAHTHFSSPIWVADIVSILAQAAFFALAVAYLVKIIFSFDHVKKEFAHPIAGNMFGTFAISLLLIPILLADKNLVLARIVWSIGAVAMVFLAWLMVTRWISVRQATAHATPAWIVPVVGMIDIPLALPALGWAKDFHEIMIFATAVGLFFALPLFTIIFFRLIFDEPIPDALQPSLLILVAPFAVGFSAYAATVGTIDGFAVALYMLMLFVLAVLFARIRNLGRCCPFRVSWWAVSFPLAASASAALKYALFAKSPTADVIAICLLGLASLVIGFIVVRTVVGILRGELRTLSS